MGTSSFLVHAELCLLFIDIIQTSAMVHVRLDKPLTLGYVHRECMS